VTATRLFLAIGLAAATAGAALWHWSRTASTRPPSIEAPAIAPAALLAATFVDSAGGSRSLGQFQGKIVVVNFWATWCGPCRAEMPAFDRLSRRWSSRGVQFVGLSGEPPETAARFGRDLAIGYPLWTGGDQAQELSRRLGNRLGVLPHTVVVGAAGQVLEQRVGPYTEAELEEKLLQFTVKLQ
jgi:thiol-disulfide isomerase/thioredoxin